MYVCMYVCMYFTQDSATGAAHKFLMMAVEELFSDWLASH